MKDILILFLFLNVLPFFSQEVYFPDNFTRKEIKNLKQLDLSFKTYSFDDNNFNRDLKDLAYFNKKRKQNKVWAYAMSISGTVLLTAGFAIKSEKDLHGFKSLMFLNSAMYFGGAIPFFIGHKKNKKKMKKKLIFVQDKLNRLH